MKNFMIGILMTILVIIAWPQISQIVDDTAVNPQINITEPVTDQRTVTTDKQNPTPTAIEETIEQIEILPTASIEEKRAKQHESIQDSIDNDPNRRGRNGD